MPGEVPAFQTQNKDEKRNAVKRCCVIFIYWPSINKCFLLHSAHTHLDFLLMTFIQPIDCPQMSHEMNLSFFKFHHFYTIFIF